MTEREFDGLPVVLADVGPKDGPRVIFHGHLDVVPARDGQFTPRVEGDRLIGRGAYDMKGALAAMMCALPDVAAQDAVGVRFVCVPDEESEDVERPLDRRARGRGPARPTSRSRASRPTCTSASRPRACSPCASQVNGTAAHGSTPWLGDNAILKAHDAFRRIETLPFSRESSDLFDRPSINLARIDGGDAFNKVPDTCTIDVDIRFLPNQDPDAILEQIRADRRPRDRQDLHARAGDRVARATPTCSRCATPSAARSRATR